ncbi:Smr/MutS family protein [Marixanthomonas spongiae]|uniref:DNA mismatch repair protein MutS n=1 Tax=Marixanthomonas spongiae TaxID=2174845 RepID=A0A2U0I414_9FLAO|nr:Smr/MutS family protein [Marixanthomonas spongiae]PVW15852.1 DNA mismatch repair protein MutS [Marixanthomonas spongiae]
MKKGDTVSVLDDAITGVVTAVDGDTISVLTDDDFEMQFQEQELVVLTGELSESDVMQEDISEILAQKQTKKPKPSKKTKPKERNRPPMVIDLHIHQLTQQYKRMSNHEMLVLQTDTAKRQLDFAIDKKIQRVVFIHGVGEGVLKAELEYLFRRYDNVKYYEADYREYGRGATEVYIFQNKTP